MGSKYSCPLLWKEKLSLLHWTINMSSLWSDRDTVSVIQGFKKTLPLLQKETLSPNASKTLSSKALCYTNISEHLVWKKRSWLTWRHAEMWKSHAKLSTNAGLLWMNYFVCQNVLISFFQKIFWLGEEFYVDRFFFSVFKR